jgi:glycosyltransferase involved in cell wall biosynthesis
MVLENNAYPVDTRVCQEAETLAKSSYVVSVICPRRAGQQWRETINGVRVYRFPQVPDGRGAFSYLMEFGYATAVSTLLTLWLWMRWGLDVVHVHNPPDTLFIAGLLARLAGKKLIYDHHDLSPELYLSKFGVANERLYKMLLRLERWSCRLANRVITVNESYRKIDIERNGLPPERICIVRNGPNLDHLRLYPPDLALVSRGVPLIAYLGNISSQDGVDQLLWALHYLDSNLGHRNWFCIIVGPADNGETLRQLAATLEIMDRVWFMGYLPLKKWLPILSAADICIAPEPSSPLNDKSTMIKVMEYMALGKPVVCYDLPEHRASAGQAALYARPNDALDLARQLALLIEQPELRLRLGAIGRQRVEQQLAWKFSAERLLHIYAEITATP